VRARSGIAIVCFCAWCFGICLGSALQAQTTTAPPQPAAPSAQDATNDLFVATDKTVVLDVSRPVSRVAVGLGEIVEATAVSPTEVLVNGKAPGETSLIVWEQGGGRQFFNVTVRPGTGEETDRLEGLRRELRTELPGQPVRVTSENGLIFLRGTVKDLTSSDRAVQIASTAGKVVNLLYVDVPPPERQILLKVRFCSVDRNWEKQLGINIFSLGAANSLGSVTTQQFSPPTIASPQIGGGSGSSSSGASASTGATASLSNLLNLFIFRPDLNLGATIEALVTRGLAEVLAEPNVLAENGKEASFLAGGQFPYPVVQGVTGTGAGAITIQFKEFGVRLSFIPTITPRNTIRLQVAPEVSSLDFANGITISGFTVPGIDIRTVNTEVELADGQSFVIGGLLDNRENETFEKIPYIGDIPVLGKFFQSIQRTKTNTELIVIVTPEIVGPIPAGAPLPALKYPQKFLPPNSNIPMMTPGPDVTGAVTPTTPEAAMPVEKLIESMKPERPLNTTSSSGSGAGYSSSQGGMSPTAGGTSP
jgi:pilus assembly protein CpaC